MTAASGNRYSRRYPMTDYNWQQLAHDLAVEYFGGREDIEPCGCKSVQVKHVTRMLRSVLCEEHVDSWKDEREWIPEIDLNQAWMLFKEAISEKTEIKVDPSEDISAELFCKQLMFLSVYYSDLNLTDYEVSDGTQRK
jgi:hypothetical protein